MGFINWVPPPKENCPHQYPDYRKGRAFGKGTTWRCDACGAAYEYKGIEYDQRDNDEWPQWVRRADLDGPDLRPRPSTNYMDR